VLEKLFWLALIAMILGVLSYLVTVILGHKSKPLADRVDLVNASLDLKDSPYRETKEGLIQIEKIDRVNNRHYRYDFPTIDFKFQNTGNATAFIWQFSINVIEAQLDITPVFSFRASTREPELYITATNNGWGEARAFETQVDEPSLTEIYDPPLRQYSGTVGSGQRVEIIKLSTEQARKDWLERIKDQLAPFNRYSGYEAHSLDSGTVKGVKLLSMKAVWRCEDEKENKHSGEQSISIDDDAMFLTPKGFMGINYPPNPAMFAESDSTFVTIIDPTKKPQELKYQISRKIPSGDIERFHIMIGSSMSCHLRLKVSFYIGKSDVVQSDTFSLDIWNPRNSGWNYHYEDGAEIDRKLNEVKAQTKRHELSYQQRRELDSIQEQASNFPFIK
jgi:hypothetical protein